MNAAAFLLPASDLFGEMELLYMRIMVIFLFTSVQPIKHHVAHQAFLKHTYSLFLGNSPLSTEMQSFIFLKRSLSLSLSVFPPLSPSLSIA